MPEVICKLEGPKNPREQWLQQRLTGIGGSEAPVILGLSPWKSPITLWSEKVGLLEADDISEVSYVKWGNILEQPIAEEYSRETGRKLINHGRYRIFRDMVRPHMICTHDREIISLSSSLSGSGILSIKTAMIFKQEQWQDEDGNPEAPLAYQAQLHHELLVRGYKWGSFAALLGGHHFIWFDVVRNEKFCSYLLEKEEEFWYHVKAETLPKADASDSTKETLLRLYPKDTGETVALPAEAYEWAEERARLKGEKKRIEEAIQGYENNLKAAIGEAFIGLLPDGSGFKWAYQERAGYEVKPTKFRVLREVKKK